LNATFQTGFYNPIDEAIKAASDRDINAFKKIDEVPYDFQRKRLSIVIKENNRQIMITKGAVNNVLAVCTNAESVDNKFLKVQYFE
jgi:Mg2+-importing ATPase